MKSVVNKNFLRMDAGAMEELFSRIEVNLTKHICLAETNFSQRVYVHRFAVLANNSC